MLGYPLPQGWCFCLAKEDVGVWGAVPVACSSNSCRVCHVHRTDVWALQKGHLLETQLSEDTAKGNSLLCRYNYIQGVKMLGAYLYEVSQLKD